MSLTSEQQYIELLSLLRNYITIQTHEVFERLKQNTHKNEPKSLVRFGQKIYSQNEEDGITREIFRRIGVTNRTFIEIGIGNGLENNTMALLLAGWEGLWIETNKINVQTISKSLPKTIESGKLAVINAFVTRENINELLVSKLSKKEVDLLSIDIDGNDYHVFKAINCVSPRVVIIEYNAKYPPPIEYTMKYDPSHKWDGTDSFGISLKSLEINMRKLNYSLVCANLTGTNSFFIRSDLVGEKFLKPYTAEIHYQPARYYLRALSSGHQPSYATLENQHYVAHE